MIRGQPVDDSGLIDLKALMEASRAAERAPTRSEVTPVPVVRNLDLYPFGAPTPPEPAPAPAPEEKPRVRPAAVRVAVPVLGGVALAGALALVLLSGGPREGEQAAAVAAPGDRAPTHEAAALPVPPPAAEPAPPPAAPSESGSVTKPPVTTKPPVKPAPVKPAPVKPAPVKPAPAKPPAPSPCNGDLRCEMERAVRGQ